MILWSLCVSSMLSPYCANFKAPSFLCLTFVTVICPQCNTILTQTSLPVLQLPLAWPTQTSWTRWARTSASPCRTIWPAPAPPLESPCAATPPSSSPSTCCTASTARWWRTSSASTFWRTLQAWTRCYETCWTPTTTTTTRSQRGSVKERWKGRQHHRNQTPHHHRRRHHRRCRNSGITALGN